MRVMDLQGFEVVGHLVEILVRKKSWVRSPTDLEIHNHGERLTEEGQMAQMPSETAL